MEFKEFPKLSRFSRDIVITEKIDGTNAQIFIQKTILEENKGINTIILDDGEYTIRAGSRTKWITPDNDNYGFANWVKDHAKELIKGLGEGSHFGEWWGSGIQRGYGLQKGEKRFSLFNTSRWKIDSFEEKGFENPPKCCHIVPILYSGELDTQKIQEVLNDLIEHGSYAADGFKNPEGIVIFHTAANVMFKKTCIKDDKHKSEIIKEKINQ